MRREDILVSVTLTSYNHAEFVRKAIESVLGQTHKNIELLIIDDGSTDKSAEIISGYDDPRINFVKCEENTAFAAYENTFAQAKGKYIVETCSDDVLFPDMIEKYIDFMEEHEEYGCCFCIPQIIDENDNSVEGGFWNSMFNETNKTKEQWFKRLFLQGNCFCNPSVCFRKEIFEKLVPYRFQYRQLQDWDLWLRLVQVANIYIYPEKLMQYRVHFGGDNLNLGAPTVEAQLRDLMEKKYIHLDTIEKVQDDFFIKAFEDELILHPGQEGFCVECEKFSVLLNSPIIHPHVAVFYYFRHYDDKQFRFCMENYYHVSRKDFWQYSGADFDNLGTDIKNKEIILELTSINVQLRELVEAKDKQLNAIKDILKL